MNYFTQDWVSGNLSENDAKETKLLYLNHIDSILPKCSAAVKKLATEINLHDGRMSHCIVDRQAAALDLIFRCGDLELGYFDLSLQYSQVLFSVNEIFSLAKIARSRDAELLYCEVDVDENQNYVHRMLFSTFDEISVTFSGLKIKKKRKKNRTLSVVDDPFKTNYGTHADGTICLENTQSVPNHFVPCCEVFAGHTKTCTYDIRYEWLKNANQWAIAIPESAGGGGITIAFCPHCGKML